MNKQDIDFSILSECLPPLVWRARWNDLADRYGLPFKKGYMQNLDSIDKGPKKLFFNKRVAYRKEDLIAWLNGLKSRQ